MTKRSIFITGGSGFVGRHVAAALEARGHLVSAPDVRLDDIEGLTSQLSSRNWDFIFHFAAVSSFAFCEQNPDLAFETNVNGTRTICELASELTPAARLIFASTGQVYKISEGPLTEESPVEPRTVYAKTKLEAEKIVALSAERGLKSIILRIFNHTHHTQSPSFFLPGIFDQLKKAEDRQASLMVGNLEIERDLGAISDLQRAMASLVDSSNTLHQYELFNLCSGHARSLKTLVKRLSQKMGVDATLEIDPARFRPDEPKRLVGSYEKFSLATGWQPVSGTDDQFLDSFLGPVTPVESPRQTSENFGVIAPPSAQKKEAP